MDSKAVTRRFKETLRPELKTAGFTAFTDRTSWRYGDGVTHVVNVQSFNDHTAHGVGCTTYSFAVNLGVYFEGDRAPRRADRTQEFECTLRFGLRKSIVQPLFHPYGRRRDGSDRPDVWYVKPDGSNLDEVVADACSTLLDEGLRVLEQFSDPGHASQLLKEAGEPPSRRTVAPHVEVGSLPAPGSPRWNEITALLASYG